MRKFFFLLGAALVLFVGFTVAVTARYGSAQLPVQAVPEVAIPDGAAERLAGSLRIRTISSEDPAAFDADAFEAVAHLSAEQRFRGCMRSSDGKRWRRTAFFTPGRAATPLSIRSC